MKTIRNLTDKSDGGWWSSVFGHKVDVRKDAHSNLLSKKATSGLYKIQCKLFLIPSKQMGLMTQYDIKQTGLCVIVQEYLSRINACRKMITWNL